MIRNKNNKLPRCFLEWAKLLLLITTAILAAVSSSVISEITAQIAGGPSPSSIFIVKAELKEKRAARGVTISKKIFTFEEDLTRIYFPDPKNGWLIGDLKENHDARFTKSLYKTSNGGKSWSKVSLKFLRNKYITDVFFEDSHKGWILANSKAAGWDTRKFRFEIFNTADGGKTWSSQRKENFARAKKFVFADALNGWAIGTRYPSGFKDSSGFLLKTTDGGKTWSDSHPLPKGWINDIYLREENKLILASGSRFFKSEDAGKTWVSFTADFSNEFLNKPIAGINEGINKIGRLPDGRL